MVSSEVLKLYAPSKNFLAGFFAGKNAGQQLDVWDFFRTWFHYFYTLGTNLFSYTGLSDDLQKQIEKRFLYFGVCGIIEKDGDLIAVDASGSGENVYAEPTEFTFSFSNGTGDKKQFLRKINVDGVFARNTFDYYPAFYDIEKMAFTMAHIDMSIVCESINCRASDIFKAGNEKAAESARTFYNKLYRGELSIITDKSEELEIDRPTRTTNNMKELLDAKERTLKSYYELFGIRKQNEKRERMITDEVQANEELLHFNLKDMLESRKEMCKNIESVFGVSCSVVSHVDIDGDGTKENEKEMGVNDNANE